MAEKVLREKMRDLPRDELMAVVGEIGMWDSIYWPNEDEPDTWEFRFSNVQMVAAAAVVASVWDAIFNPDPIPVVVQSTDA